LGGVVGQHAGDLAVGGVAFHLAEAHGADMQAGGAEQPRHFRQDQGGVAALRLGRGHRPVPGAVIVQELAGEVAADAGHRRRPGDVAVDQEGDVGGVLAENLQDRLGAGDDLRRVVGGDVGGKQLGLAGRVLGPGHRVGDRAHGLLQRREHLIALRLVVLDEVAAQPEGVTGVGEGLRAQAQLRLDDGADDRAAVRFGASQDAPESGDVGGGAVEQRQEVGRHVEIQHLGVFDVAHALVVAHGEGEERGDHRLAVEDVAVEQIHRVGDFHQLARRIDGIDQGVEVPGEVVGGADLDVGSGRGLGGEMRRRRQVIPGLRLHRIGSEKVPPPGDQAGFVERQVGVAVRLVHGRGSPSLGWVRGIG
jgi:hypothetical protein